MLILKDSRCWSTKETLSKPTGNESVCGDLESTSKGVKSQWKRLFDLLNWCVELFFCTKMKSSQII